MPAKKRVKLSERAESKSTTVNDEEEEEKPDDSTSSKTEDSSKKGKKPILVVLPGIVFFLLGWLSFNQRGFWASFWKHGESCKVLFALLFFFFGISHTSLCLQVLKPLSGKMTIRTAKFNWNKMKAGFKANVSFPNNQVIRKMLHKCWLCVQRTPPSSFWCVLCFGCLDLGFVGWTFFAHFFVVFFLMHSSRCICLLRNTGK